jgi:hypothetical protein
MPNKDLPPVIYPIGSPQPPSPNMDTGAGCTNCEHPAPPPSPPTETECVETPITPETKPSVYGNPVPLNTKESMKI